MIVIFDLILIIINEKNNIIRSEQESNVCLTWQMSQVHEIASKYNYGNNSFAGYVKQIAAEVKREQLATLGKKIIANKSLSSIFPNQLEALNDDLDIDWEISNAQIPIHVENVIINNIGAELFLDKFLINEAKADTCPFFVRGRTTRNADTGSIKNGKPCNDIRLTGAQKKWLVDKFNSGDADCDWSFKSSRVVERVQESMNGDLVSDKKNASPLEKLQIDFVVGDDEDVSQDARFETGSLMVVNDGKSIHANYNAWLYLITNIKSFQGKRLIGHHFARQILREL